MSGLATASYAYDAHNRRVKQIIDGETIYSVYGVGGDLVFRDNITTGEETAYITVGGRSVARLVTQGVVTTTTYIHNDHLGSSSMGTTAAGGFAPAGAFYAFNRSPGSIDR